MVPLRYGPTVAVESVDPTLHWELRASRQGELVLLTWERAAQIIDVTVSDDHVSVLLSSHGVDAGEYHGQLKNNLVDVRSTPEVQEGTLRVRLPLRTERWGVPDQVIPCGVYRLRLVHEATGAKLTPVPSQTLRETFPREHLLDHMRVRFQLGAQGDHWLAVAVSPPLSPEERGQRNQHRLRATANAGSADEHSVFFRTLYGEATNDNARAIHDELRRRNTDLTLYWSIQDRSVPVPEGGIGLVENTAEWHARLGGASYVVVNVHQPMWYVKPKSQVMVQSFHGYPYKEMGQSWWARRRVSATHVHSYLERSAAWDYLVSPARYATPHLLREFFTPQAAQQVNVIEAGYPRNDILLAAEGAEIRRRVREVLGIADHQTAVLYAPTFRDYLSSDDMTAKRVDFFDPAAAAEGLGPDYVILQRGHAFNARANVTTVRGPQIRDVTYYPDIADLCLASDAAILDYSSLRFDYALTRKPMIFLVPDKDTYHSQRPGIIAYEPTAPGAHVTTTREVIKRLKNLPALTNRFRPRVETFIATYMEKEDGQATVRVVDAVFGSD